MVSSASSLSPPPLTPPPPPPVKSYGDGPYSSISYNPSLLIIAAIIAFVGIASASIHLLLRFLSRHSSSTSPLIHRNTSSSSAATTSSSSSAPLTDNDRKALLDSLPLFSLTSSLAALPKSSPDCAVCLSRFAPHDDLRLLPACRHAFHSSCIDAWLSSAPTCPLCRCSIDLPPTPEKAPPPPQASGFRVEIGSVSGGGALEESTGEYSLGSSFEYRVQDEVEVVVSRVRRRVEDAKDEEVGPAPPGPVVAEAAGVGSSRGWLKEYVDRLASSASSSFSSLRFSSRRFDGGGEGNRDFEGDAGGEEGRRSSASSYRWLTGV